MRSSRIWKVSSVSDVFELFLSSQSHKPFESKSSQNHLKFFRVESESWLGRVESESNHKNCRVTSSHWLTSSSQCRATQNLTLFLRHFFAMKWHPTCYKMATDKLENGVQHAMKWRPISWNMVSNVVLTSLIAGYILHILFSVCMFLVSFTLNHFKNLSSPTLLEVLQPLLTLWWMCDSPRTGCGWRTTPMWREQAEIRWARRGIFIVAWYDSLKICALAALPFQSQQSGALTRMWRWCQVQPSQKERVIGAVHCKNEGMLLQLLGWSCIESAVFVRPIHENDQIWTCTWI